MLDNWRSLYKVQFILILAFFAKADWSNAQYFEFEHSDEFKYTNRKSGFFTEYIGANLTNLYLLQRNSSKSKPYDNAKLMIVSLSKNTMAEDTFVPIKGFPQNKSQEEILSTLDFITAVMADGDVVVFWRKLFNTDSTRREEIYAQTYKSDLMPGLPLKKVFEFEQKVDSQQSVFDPTRCVVLVDDEGEQLVLGTELWNKGKVEFQFVALSPQLVASSVMNVPLPQESKVYSPEITSTFSLKSNGNVYARSSVLYTVDELLELPNNHPKSYPALTVARVETGEHSCLKIRSENKPISDFSFEVTGGDTRVLGFFGDYNEDTTATDKQGIFYADLNNTTLAATELNFVYFNRSSLNRLFPKKRVRNKLFQSTEDELIHTRFDIEHIESMADSSLVLFFTREYNYEEKSSRSDLNGENVYSTQTFWRKKDLSALRLSREGEIMWAQSVDRKVEYVGNDVEDIQVVYKYDEFFVMYGNDLAERKPPKQKKFKHLTEELEYATFNTSTGRAKVEVVEINEPKTDPRDKHFLDPNSVVVIDDNFYFYKMRTGQNPLWTAANVIFLPTLYYTILTGNTQLAKGNFSLMRVMEGKKPRKK
jgi:hypothetical protein